MLINFHGDSIQDQWNKFQKDVSQDNEITRGTQVRDARHACMHKMETGNEMID
jgi:hypothetical protein